MAADGVLGHGIKAAYADSSPHVWNEIGQILDTDLPGLEPEEVETTVHGTSAFRRFIRGLIDVEEFSMTLLGDFGATDDHLHIKLQELQTASTTKWWRIEIPADRERTAYWAIQFEGWVKNWKPSGPIDDKQSLEVTVRFDGTAFMVQRAMASQIV